MISVAAALAWATSAAPVEESGFEFALSWTAWDRVPQRIGRSLRYLTWTRRSSGLPNSLDKNPHVSEGPQPVDVLLCEARV
ncbi:hypothetical protein B0H14DRAFT_2761017 [Mycena olivaceomarginata]|nr:hypothetical protein B0H14DRAFT_2761017 [Mycena olivaceomarginata]